MLQPQKEIPPSSDKFTFCYNFECNMLTLEQIRDYSNPSDPSETIKLSPQQIKDKLLTFDFALENVNCQLKLLGPLPTVGANPKAIERKRLQDKVELYKSQITALSQKLKDMNELISNQNVHLEMPNFGLRDELDTEELRLHVPLFGLSAPSISISTFWKKLITFAESKEYSEQAVKKALGNLLQGQAFELYFNIRSKSLKEIIEALEGSYSDFTTILDLDCKLHSMQRTGDQTLTNFMNEVHTLLIKTESLREKKEQFADFILQQKLKIKVA